MIFGGGPFCIWFMGFVQGGEFRWFADFQLVPARESSPSFSPFQQQQLRQFLPTARMQFLVAAISCFSERVLHLP